MSRSRPAATGLKKLTIAEGPNGPLYVTRAGYGALRGEVDIPPVPEFIEMISGSGAGIYGCQAP